MRHAFAMLVLVVLGGVLGCVEQSAELSAADREQLREYVGTTAPTPQHELDVQFENKVRLVGYDLSVTEARPEQAFTITWYWKSERPLEEGWRLFTHVADAAGANRLNQDGEGVIRRLYQPGRWKAGEYIKDEQRVTLPRDWNSPRATFYLGMYNGPHRLEITRGPNDGENRVRAVPVPVAGSTTPQPGGAAPRPRVDDVPTVRGTKATGAINPDGRLDEAAWQQAGRTSRFVDTMNGSAAQFEASARVLWDATNLYVAFEVRDDFLKSTFRNDDDHLWEQDAVEIMVDPDGDGRNYFELQVAPTGRVFDTRYDSRRQPQPIGHADWDSNLRAGVQTQGTVNDDGADQGYTVEIAIPWTAFAAGEPPATPPQANALWRMNFYVMDARQEADQQRAAGWSPPRVGDFHVPPRFGRVVFFDPAAPPAPTAIAPGGLQPPAVAVPGQPGQAMPLRLPPEMLEKLRRGLPTRSGTAQEAQHVNEPRPGEERPQPPAPTKRAPAPAPTAP